jgi:predicted nucleic acid-binding protein
MSARHLLDTDVIVEYLRGDEQAVEFLESLEDELLVSAITVAELYSGARNETEEKTLARFLMAFEVIEVSGSIARKGGLFRRDYRQSHGTGLADALIAATAVDAEAILTTFNKRHFPMVADVQVPYRRSI